MKIKTFKSFNESKSDIDSICEDYRITNYTIDNGLVNVNGDVDLSHRELTKLPIQFGQVTGFFDCSNNQLTSLDGSPHKVHNFDCSYNNLTDLAGSPKEVGGGFYCSNNNKLTSLVGAPELIEDIFYCLITPIHSIFQSDDAKLISIFNMIFESGIDLPLIEYWFSIIKQNLTKNRFEEIKKHYPNI
jgi:hypothetical protein